MNDKSSSNEEERVGVVKQIDLANNVQARYASLLSVAKKKKKRLFT